MENKEKDVFSIENETLKVSASTKGAELMSIKSRDGIEYLWQGNPEFWAGRSPILFPIVGALRDNKATSEKGDIEMGQHGIVRHQTWDLENIEKTEMTFITKSSEDSKRAFPYDFELLTTYSLSENILKVGFKVKNPSEDALPYCIGGHPAFNVPLSEGEAFDDYYIEFEKAEIADCEMVNMAEKLIEDRKFNRLLTNSKKFGLNHVLFRGDALVFSKLKSRSVKLLSNKSGHGVEMGFDGMDYFAIWSPVMDSPFVCLEPWTGTATTVSEDDVFEKKRGMKLLSPGEEDEIYFTIKLF